MPDFIRELRVFADGQEFAQGCHICLEARETLSLNPALHHLVIHDLSASSAARLPQAGKLEVHCGSSVLAYGEPVEVLTHPRGGHRVTSVVFSPGIALWNSSVSLSLAGGMKASETIRQLLSTSGSGIPLAAYAANDPVFSRPQAFFGRTCDALTLLAESTDADVFLSSAGLCVQGRSTQSPSISLAEDALSSEPIRSGNRWIISTVLAGWLPGCAMEFAWHGITHSGRILSRMIQADNNSGPWRSELEVEAAYADH